MNNKWGPNYTFPSPNVWLAGIISKFTYNRTFIDYRHMKALYRISHGHLCSYILISRLNIDTRNQVTRIKPKHSNRNGSPTAPWKLGDFSKSSSTVSLAFPGLPKLFQDFKTIEPQTQLLWLDNRLLTLFLEWKVKTTAWNWTRNCLTCWPLQLHKTDKESNGKLQQGQFWCRLNWKAFACGIPYA